MAALEERRLQLGDEPGTGMAPVGAPVTAHSKWKALQGEFDLSGRGMAPCHRLLRQRPAAPKACLGLPPE